jgi:AraC-like DNA-binding protein
MTYKELPPNDLLANFVQCYWWFSNTTSHSLDFTILPDGCFDLLVHFRNNQLHEIALTGIWTKQVDVSIEPNTQIFGIRFTLLAVDYIFQKNIADILNSERQIENNFWHINKTDLLNLKNATGHFNNIMLSLLSSRNNIDAKKKNLFHLLHQTNGELTVQQYSKQVFWTSRQINRYFNERFGISLKQYCNILKVFASFKHIKNGQLYPEGNYFDQSHFIKYVRKHTGTNPEDLYENKNDRFLQLTTTAEK